MSPVVTLYALGVIGLVAFATEGAIGFGGTVLLASIGAQLIPLAVILPAFVPLNLVLSSWLLARGTRSVSWRMLAVEIAPPVGLGAAVGLAAFHLPGKTWFLLAFAIFVVGLATFELARPSTTELGRPARIALLVLGGVAHGLFGTGGPLIVYVVRRRVSDKRAFRATLAVLWLVLNLALLLNFASAHLYGHAAGAAMIAIAIAIVPGMWLGERLHARLDPHRFERAVWWLLLVAGAALAIRSAIAVAS